MKFLRRWSFLILAVGGMALGWSASVWAAPPFPIAGRGEFRGYFTDQYDCSGHNVWPSPAGVNPMPVYPNATAFINDVMDKLQNGNAQQHVGSAFIILSMLGGSDHTPPYGGNPTGAVIDEWKARVLYAESRGWIEWNRPYAYNANSLYQGGTNGGTRNCQTEPNPVDDAFYPEVGVSPAAIVIHDGPNFFYAIQLSCANPLGDLPGVPGLPPVDYNLQVNLLPGSDAPPWGGVIEAGKTYHLTPVVQNFGPAASRDSFMDVNNFQHQYVTVRGAATTGGWAYNQGYIPNPCNFGPQCWFWWYHSIPNGQIVSQPDGLTFQASTATPDGQQVCFNAAIVPHNLGGQPAYYPPPPNPALCYTVFKVHHPGIVSKNGDVHAGGDLCGQAQNTTGAIFTNPSSNSMNEYVVSANGLSSNFGSNNTAGGNAATLGRNGNYHSVCRPDLSAKAIAYLNVGVPGVDYIILPGGSYDVGTLPAIPGNVYYFRGPVTLHGTYNRKMTIAAPHVTIDGNIILSAPNIVGSQAPSLGIITNEDILIGGAARQIDAYLFADGTINTCIEGNTAACANTLTVNGFLMGRTLSFRRLGPATSATAATVGEQVNLTGQLYLNPPKFFDNAADANLLQHGGEKPPLN